MAYELSFSPEFFSDEHADYEKSKRPWTVRQAIFNMDEEDWDRMVADVFPNVGNPDYIDTDMVMDEIMETNTVGTLTPPVDVWIDAEGYHRVYVYDEPDESAVKDFEFDDEDED